MSEEFRKKIEEIYDMVEEYEKSFPTPISRTRMKRKSIKQILSLMRSTVKEQKPTVIWKHGVQVNPDGIEENILDQYEANLLKEMGDK